MENWSDVDVSKMDIRDVVAICDSVSRSGKAGLAVFKGDWYRACISPLGDIVMITMPGTTPLSPDGPDGRRMKVMAVMKSDDVHNTVKGGIYEIVCKDVSDNGRRYVTVIDDANMHHRIRESKIEYAGVYIDPPRFMHDDM